MPDHLWRIHLAACDTGISITAGSTDGVYQTMEFTTQFRTLALLTAVIILCGCSSISEQECQTGDWYSIGVNDGKDGADIKRYKKYQKECASHGITADFAWYQQGYQQGLVFYCDFAHGEAHGRSGASYNTACTGKLEPQFRLGYQKGKEWYQVRSAVDNLQFELEQRYRQIQQNRELIYANNQQLAREQDPNVRANLLYRNDHLGAELDQLNTEAGRLQVQLYQAEQAFMQVERQQQQQNRRQP